MVLKKTVHDKLVTKVNNIDASRFAVKTKYDTDKSELENKILGVTDFVKKAKLTELQNKIPDVSNLATKTALTTVENTITSVSITQKLQKLKINLLTIIRTNVLILQSLIN